MEYASNGQLFDILRYSGALNESIVRTYFHSIISALKCFHEQGIIHRDLKPQNILLDSRFNIKICDFGLSIVVKNKNNDQHSQKQMGKVGTKGYIAPEILNGQPYDKSCDIFSTGVILYNLLTARSPFKEATSNDNKYKLLMTQSNPDDTGGIGVCTAFWSLVNTTKNGLTQKHCLIDERIQHLIENMVKYNSTERITIDKIKQHSWYCVSTQNKIVDNQQLLNIMIVKHNQAKEHKLRVLNSRKSKKNNDNNSSDTKEATNEDDDEMDQAYTNADIIDQERTLAEFESSLSQFGVSVAKPHTQVELELVTIDEHNEVDQKEFENEEKQQPIVGGTTYAGGNAVSKLSQYMSSQVTSEIGLGSMWSMKCYTICNPLVVMVGIGEYHDSLQNLIGMTKDYKNMIYTFNNKYGYAFYYQTKDNKMIYTKNSIIDLKSAHISEIIKIEWSEEEIMDFIDCARDVVVSNKHDSVILIISSHGESNGVIFDSEFEEVQLFAIFYKFMRNECPYLQDKAKIVLVDACRGSLKSIVPTAQPESQAESQSEKQVLKGKQNNTNQTVNDANANTKDQSENGKDVKSDTKVKKSKLEEKFSAYHQEGNYRIIYANIEGYAVLGGGKKGGYLLQAVKKVFCDQNQILNKNTHFEDVVLQINKKSQKLAGTNVVVQQVQDVNQMDGNIIFQTRKM